MHLLSLIISFYTYSATLNLFSYQTVVTGSKMSCQEEAENLAIRFQLVTGTQVESWKCRSQKDVASDSTYSLGLIYKNSFAIVPYKIEMNKNFYSTLSDCLSDVQNQIEIFEKFTGLRSLVGTCEAPDSIYYQKNYTLRIEGVGLNGLAKPQSYLFQLTPQIIQKFSPELINEIYLRLIQMNFYVVKKSTTSVAYYGPQQANLNAQQFSFFNKPEDCTIQLRNIENAYRKAGLKNIKNWCDQNVMTVIYDHQSFLIDYLPQKPILYSNLSECLNDSDFILSDSNLSTSAVGALCVDSIKPSQPHAYEMKLLRKAW